MAGINLAQLALFPMILSEPLLFVCLSVESQSLVGRFWSHAVVITAD